MIADRSSLGCLLLLGVFSFAAMGCSSSSEEERVEKVGLPVSKPKPAQLTELPGISTEGLRGAAKEAFVEVVNDLLSPCGEPVSIARCVVDEVACRECSSAARYAARLAGLGYPSQVLRGQVLQRYGKGTKVEIATDGAPYKGAMMAPVTIVEFSDFQCPSCRHAAPELDKVIRDLGGKARLVFKHFPLPQHSYAEKAARAAAAAGEQGKFWEYHDLVFANQHRLDDASFERFAKELGLDLSRFTADFESEAIRDRVSADRQQGIEAGVQGTPSLFVNGREYTGGIEDLVPYVFEELEG